MKKKHIHIISLALLVAAALAASFFVEYADGESYPEMLWREVSEKMGWSVAEDDLAEREEQFKVNVTAVPAGHHDLEITMSSSGTFDFFKEVQISSQQQGRIKKLLVQEVGAEVDEEELLAILEQDVVEIEKSRAITERHQRQIELMMNRAERTTLETQIRQAESTYLRRQENLRHAQNSYENNLMLFELDAITEQELAKVSQARFEAVSELLEARLNMLQMMRERQQLTHQIELAEAQVEQAEHLVQRMEHEMEETEIRAPLNGVVSEVEVNEGEILQPGGNLLMTIMDLSRIFLEVKVPETEIARIFRSQPVEVSPDAYPGLQLEGEVTNIDPKVEPQSRTFNVRVRVDASGEPVKPGMFGRARFLIEKREDVLVVPKEAIIYSPESGERQAQVYIVRDDVALKRSVEVDAQSDKFVQIVNGLTSGDIVVVDGQDRLREFSRVETKLVDLLDS